MVLDISSVSQQETAKECATRQTCGGCRPNVCGLWTLKLLVSHSPTFGNCRNATPLQPLFASDNMSLWIEFHTPKCYSETAVTGHNAGRMLLELI